MIFNLSLYFLITLAVVGYWGKENGFSFPVLHAPGVKGCIIFLKFDN